MDINFKIADISDKNAILGFMREYYEFDHLTFDDRIARNALKKLLNNRSLGVVWIIQDKVNPIGYAVLTPGFSLEYGGRDAFIDELYIRESHRRQGIGQKTIEFLEDFCRSSDIRAIHLEVDRQNFNAQWFYRKTGFVDDGRYLMTKCIIKPEDKAQG